MLRGSPRFIVSFLSFGFVAASASTIAVYQVTVNTSSISGTARSFDFNFNPGPLVTQSATLQVVSFAANGALTGGPMPAGDVSGTLPATLTFDNGTGLNDYFQGFTFGSSLSFQFGIYGPAVNSPDGISTSGSTFAFSVFSNAAGTTPALTADTTNGFAFTVNLNLDGTATLTNSSGGYVTIQFSQVTQATQTITFGALNDIAFSAVPSTLAATASSGLAVSFTSTTPLVCAISGYALTLVAAGTCSITANQAGNIAYAAATPVSQSFQAAQYSPCDLKQTGNIGVADVQLIINEALGVAPVVYDLSGTGVVNVVDVQIEINAALGLGCAAR